MSLIRVRHSSDSLAPRAKASAQILLGPLRDCNLHAVAQRAPDLDKQDPPANCLGHLKMQHSFGKPFHHLSLPQAILPLSEAHTQSPVSHMLYNIAQSCSLVSVSFLMSCHGGTHLEPRMKPFPLQVFFPS